MRVLFLSLQLYSAASRSLHMRKHVLDLHATCEPGWKFRPARECCVAGLEWGRNRTSDLLFVTWQPHRDIVVNRPDFHQSLGVQDGNHVYNFSTSTHPGSALGLSPDGMLLLLRPADKNAYCQQDPELPLQPTLAVITNSPSLT